MKKYTILFVIGLFVVSCATPNAVKPSNALYEIVMMNDYGGGSFEFYETLTEANEYKMLLADKKLKKKIKQDDIKTANFILVNLGIKHNEGYKVEVTQIEELSDKIVIQIKAIEPSKAPNDAINATPYAILKINSKKAVVIN